MKDLKNTVLENVVPEFMEDIAKSWTWEKLTEDERSRFRDLIRTLDTNGRIKGRESTRRDMLFALYHAFLLGCGQVSLNWRSA